LRNLAKKQSNKQRDTLTNKHDEKQPPRGGNNNVNICQVVPVKLFNE